MTNAAPPQALDLDGIVRRLQTGEKAWGQTPVAKRRQLLLAVQAAVAANAAEWVETATRIKQIPEGSQLAGEEWISGPWALVGHCDALAETLQRIADGADPLDSYPFRTSSTGQVTIDVLPHGIFDKLLLNGFRAEVWMQPGVTEAEARGSAGLGQRNPAQTDGVALVLGAGNIFSIAPLDVLYQLYAHNRVVVLKLNPTTDPLLAVFRTIFGPLIDSGYVEIVTGGADVGTALAHHPGISAVHMTGSESTHDAVVWGVGAEGTAAKAARQPRLDKPVTSELGGVSPVIVVPGPWSDADLKFQAEHVATQRLHNSGFNCVAAQILVVSSDWEQKHAFLAAVRSAMAQAPARPAWYPGCDRRVADARHAHPDAVQIGGTPLRTLLPDLDLADSAESAFSTEYFGPVLGVAELPGTGAEFLSAAVQASNERLRGTLGANIIIHPATARTLGRALDDSVAALRYGTIGVNAWTGVGYLAARATWGAFPGHPLEDAQSGIGVVHNALLLDRTQRTVVHGPFRPAPRSVLNLELTLAPKPPWFLTNKTAATTGRLLTAFSAAPRWSALPAIFASALRG